MRLRLVLAVAALAGVPAAPADAADRIAFAAGGDIQLISPAGNGLDNLTATPAAIETRPAWSPDAQRIAYMRLNAGRFEIWTMKPDGSAQAPLVTHPTHHAVAPTWSPDGRRMAYNLQDPASSAGQIVATDLDGANPVTLASGVQVNNFGLWWSPTGQQVAFGTSGLTLYVAATDGSGPSELLGPPTQLADQAKFSPKGDRIAYLGCESATQCNNSDIWIMDADTSDRERLTTDPLGDTAPAISAKGDRIAYTRFQAAGGQLRVMSITGTADAAVPNAPVGAVHADWEPLGDSDGDGLLDAWESGPIDTDGDAITDLDLSAMGAEPDHKDIFVELDCMAPHCYADSLLAGVIKAFADAPVANPDGTNGIRLHVDNGSASVMNPVTGATWGALSKAEVIPHQNTIGSFTGDDYNWADFDALKNLHFAIPRRRAFHYAISVHQLGNGPDFAGLSRGVDDGASDFVLSQGGVVGGNDTTRGSADFQANTFMHELGHNLGLKHGGNDHEPYKPSYLSIMNYTFPGAMHKLDGTRVLDYSRHPVSLDERALNELTGFGAVGAAAGFITASACPDGTDQRVVVQVAPIDWDCDTNATGSVAVDTNERNGTTFFLGHTDWDKLVYSGGLVGLKNDTLPSSTVADEPTMAERNAAQAVLDSAPRTFTVPGLAHTPTPTPPLDPQRSVGPPSPSAVAVRLSALRLAPRKVRRTARITFSLTRSATVRFTVERAIGGRRSAGRCRATARRGTRCTLFKGVRGSFSHTAVAGANTVRFSRRLGGRNLSRGSYRLVATPEGGSPARIAFTVTR